MSTGRTTSVSIATALAALAGYNAAISVAGLPSGRYRLEVLIRRGARERRSYRWVQVE